MIGDPQQNDDVGDRPGDDLPDCLRESGSHFRQFLDHHSIAVAIVCLLLMTVLGLVLVNTALKHLAISELAKFGIALIPFFILPIILLLLLSGSHYVKGKRLCRKAAYPAAARQFRIAVREGYPDAAVAMGDLYLAGLGVPRSADQALACYKYAIQLMDKRFSLKDYFSEVAYKKSQADSLKKYPANARDWFEELRKKLGILEPEHEGVHPPLADIANKLGDVEATVRHARHVPVTGNADTGQAACFRNMLDISLDTVNRCRDKKDPAATASVPGIVPRWWHITRVEIEQALVYPILIGLLLAAVYRFGTVDSEFLGKLIAYALIGCGFLIIKHIGKRDKFIIGERHFLAGRYGAAARIFSKLRDKNDPRAWKRLGDMHAAGLGLPLAADKAITAYDEAHTYMNFAGLFGESSNLGKFFTVPGLSNDELELASWLDDIRASLKTLGLKGNAAAYALLADMEPKPGCKRVEYAREAYRLDPTAAREADLASHILRVRPANREALDASLEVLERSAREDPIHYHDLVGFHAGRLDDKDFKNASQAMMYFRMWLRAAAKSGDAGKYAFYLVLQTFWLLEELGPDAFADEDLLAVLRLQNDCAKRSAEDA